MLYTTLIIVLVIALLGGIPNGFYGGGPYLGGTLGVVVLVLLILMLAGRL